MEIYHNKTEKGRTDRQCLIEKYAPTNMYIVSPIHLSTHLYFKWPISQTKSRAEHGISSLFQSFKHTTLNNKEFSML